MMQNNENNKSHENQSAPVAKENHDLKAQTHQQKPQDKPLENGEKTNHKPRNNRRFKNNKQQYRLILSV